MNEEKKREVVMVVKCAPVPITFDTLVGILANGFNGICGFDDLDFSQDDYAKAEAVLLKQGNDNLCIEEVEAQMLVMSMPLKLHEAEEAKDEGWYELTLAKLQEAIAKYDADTNFDGNTHDVAEQSGDLDFYDYDAILQYACYGEVKIG